MNNDEALALLKQQLEQHRQASYQALADRIGADEWRTDVRGSSGADYQVEVLCLWDDQPGGNVRVIGAIDDGGWRAFAPLSDSFVVDADGRFIGE